MCILFVCHGMCREGRGQRFGVSSLLQAILEFWGWDSGDWVAESSYWHNFQISNTEHDAVKCVRIVT